MSTAIETTKLTTEGRGKSITGKVIKKSGDKTISIFVERKVVHPKYRKIVKRFKKYLVHDADNIAKVGDVIEAREHRPFSKNKSFLLSRRVTVGVE